MKKKVKLFSTIASLCLAVALMAFGVWAAKNVTYTITGNVTFTADAHVNAKISFESTATNLEEHEKLKNEATKVLYDTPVDASKGEATGSLELGDVTDLKATAANVACQYSYTITVENKAKDTDTNKYLKVVVTAAGKTATTYDVDGYEVTFTGDLAVADGVVLGVGESKTYTITIKFDPSRDMAKQDIGSVITLTAQKTNA